MPHYNLKASVDMTIEAENPSIAKKLAFDLLTSAKQPVKRGPKSGSAGSASVTGVTIDESGQYELRVAKVKDEWLKRFVESADANGNADAVPVTQTAEVMETSP